MKDVFPFSNYDFWAYLTPGFVLLFVANYAFSLGVFPQSDWQIANWAIVIAVAYMLGHLLAGLASATLERRLVHKALGRPREIVLGAVQPTSIFAKIYPSYFEPLSADVQTVVLSRAKKAGLTDRDAIFWMAYEACRNNDVAMSRVGTFQNLFGLSRNLSFASLLASVILFYSAWSRHIPDNYWWGAISLFVAVGMFLRYLKFYRHYTTEVFTAFAFSKES